MRSIIKGIMQRIPLIGNIFRRAVHRFNSAMVYTQTDLRKIPPLKDIFPLYIREMDMNSEADISQWLEIHNHAFDRNWGLRKASTPRA